MCWEECLKDVDKAKRVRLLQEADATMAKLFTGDQETILTMPEAKSIYFYTDETFYQEFRKWKSRKFVMHMHFKNKHWCDYERILNQAMEKCCQSNKKNEKNGKNFYYCGMQGVKMNFAGKNENIKNNGENRMITKDDILNKHHMSFSNNFEVAALFCGENGIIFGIDNSNNSFNGADISKYSKYGKECEFLITRLQFDCNRIEFILEKESEKHQFITIVSRSDDNDKNVFDKKKNVFRDNESARKFILSSEQGSSIGEMKELKMITSQEGELETREHVNKIVAAPNGENSDGDDREGGEEGGDGCKNSKNSKRRRRRRRRRSINVTDSGYAYGDSFIKVERMKMSELEKQITMGYKRMECEKYEMIIIPNNNNDDSLKHNKNKVNNNSCILPLVYDINICKSILKTICHLYDSGNIIERRQKVSRLVSSWKHCNNDTRHHLTYFLKQFRYLLKINKHKYGWDESKLMNENREIDIRSEIHKRLCNKYRNNYLYNDYNYYYENSNNDKHTFLFNNKFVDTRLINAIGCIISDYIHKCKCANAHSLTNLKRHSKSQWNTNKKIKMKMVTRPTAGSINDENLAAMRSKRVTTNEGQAREKSEKRKKIIREIEAVVDSRIANAPQILTPNGLESATGSANGQEELAFGLFESLCHEAGL